nr:hypothetical protein WS71_29025 [Burkholderia mayonis]
MTETWTRHDSRGYVLYLKQGGSEEPFYVVTGSNITFVSMSNVVDNGQLIKPVSAPVPSRADVSVAK